MQTFYEAFADDIYLLSFGMNNIQKKQDAPPFSRIISGVWRWGKLSPSEWESLIGQALDCGITTFDHADIYGDYGCEMRFGEVLKKKPSLRRQLQIVTKCGIKLVSLARPAHRIKHYDTSAAHIIQSVENSLKNLHTNYLDVLLLHRPDPLMNPEEVAEAFTQLKQQGKVLHFGVSNFSPSQVEMLQSYLQEIPLVTNQIELSLFRHQALFDGSMDVMMKYRMLPMAWSPLGGGKFFTSAETVKTTADMLHELSEKYQCTESQLLLAWLLYHPSGIYPIVGTTKQERLSEASGALNVALDRQDWFAMLKAVTGKDVL